MTADAALAALAYDVFVSPSIPLSLTDLTPDGQARTWAPVSTTLVSGDHDAVVVEPPPLSVAQGVAVGDWVRASGRRLTHIFMTHAHADHWFTAALLAEQFPGAQVVASPATIGQMPSTVAARERFWDVVLPGQLPPSPITARPAPQGGIPLEAHELTVIDLGPPCIPRDPSMVGPGAQACSASRVNISAATERSKEGWNDKSRLMPK